MTTAKSNRRKVQTDFDIRAKTALLHRGVTITGLAAELGYARNSVSIAINHPTMLPGVKRAISQHLGLACP